VGWTRDVISYFIFILFIIISYTEYSKAKAKSKKPNYYIVAK